MTSFQISSPSTLISLLLFCYIFYCLCEACCSTYFKSSISLNSVVFFLLLALSHIGIIVKTTCRCMKSFLLKIVLTETSLLGLGLGFPRKWNAIYLLFFFILPIWETAGSSRPPFEQTSNEIRKLRKTQVVCFLKLTGNKFIFQKISLFCRWALSKIHKVKSQRSTACNSSDVLSLSEMFLNVLQATDMFIKV